MPVLDNSETWIRFHFVSDSQVTMFGVLIDDIEIDIWTETAIKGEFVEVPLSWDLHQNYPNPFNSSTTIEFSLPKSSEVTLIIFNILGEEVATLVSGHLLSGSYRYQWDASELASGVYLYKLSAGSLSTKSGHFVAGEAGEYVAIRKMILLK